MADNVPSSQGGTVYKCYRCKGYFEAEAFFKNSGKDRGISSNCKRCFKEYESSPSRKVKSTWNTINARSGKQRGYEHVQIRMTRQEFLDWALPKYEQWMKDRPDETPSLDRVDPNGHYEISNLRLLERGENSRLAKNHPNVHAKEGTAWCCRCEQYLDVSQFWRSKSNYNGLQGRCKDCQRHAINESSLSRSSHA